jgi:hypothetical protein
MCLSIHLRLYCGKNRFWEIYCNEHHLRINAVLGLRKQICCDVSGIASLVCDDLTNTISGYQLSPVKKRENHG